MYTNQLIGIIMIILNGCFSLSVCIRDGDNLVTIVMCSQNQGAGLEAHLKYQREKERAVKTGAEERMWTARETQSSI